MKMLRALMNPTAALALVCVAAGPAAADIVQVFDPSQLGPGPPAFEDFEDGTFVPGVTFGRQGGGGTQRIDASAVSGGVTTSGSFGLVTRLGMDPAPLTLTFAAPTSSVGMYFGNDEPYVGAFTASLDIFTAAGLAGTVSVAANLNDFVDQFIGFTSDQRVTSVALRYGTGSDVPLIVFIDDVRFNVAGPAAVPEPASLALLGTGGLALLGAMRRRKG